MELSYVCTVHVYSVQRVLTFLPSLQVTRGAVVKGMVATTAPVVILILVQKEEEEIRDLRKLVFRAKESLSLVEEDNVVRTTMVRKCSTMVQYAYIHINWIERA